MIKGEPKWAQAESSQFGDVSKTQRLNHSVSGHTDDETSDEESRQAYALSDNDDTGTSSEDGNEARHKIRYGRL